MKQLFVLLFIIHIAIAGFAQLDAGEDQIICIGEITQLDASGGSNYTWTSIPDDPTLSNPNIANPTVKPDTTTMYIVKSREVGNNVINNNGFELGNTGFSSEYIYNPVTIVAEGTYAIVSDANTVHPNFFCDEDHTTGDGLMMCVNGAGVPGIEVWSTSIPFISQDTEFEFSTWISSLVSGSPAILQFSINGTLLGQPFQAVPTTCQWNQFFEIWDSGNSSTATISIINQNTATGGNDFALDDISFAIVTYQYDTVIVNVLDKPTSDFSSENEICLVDSATVSYEGNAADTADYYWEFDGGNILNGTGQGPYTIHWDTPGLKEISLWVDYGCKSDTTIQTVLVNQNPEAFVIADPASIPYGTNTILHGSMSGDPGPFSFSWDPGTELVDDSSLDPTTQLLYVNTDFILTVVDESSQCKGYDTTTVEVTGGPLLITSLEAMPDTICIDESSELLLQVGGGSGNYTADWSSDPPGFSHSGPEMSISVSPSSTTKYYVVADDGFTTTSKDSVIVEVLPQISILSNPKDTIVAPQQFIQFKVETENGKYFQWQLSEDGGINWNDLSDDSSISGSNTFELTINPTTPVMDGWLFRCLVSGDCDPVYSNMAELTIVEALLMTSLLEDVTACEKDTIVVDYQASNFIEIIDLQLVIKFDSQLLTFLGLKKIQTELEPNLQVNVSGDQVTINWESSVPVTLSDGNVFSYQFECKNNGESEISWTGDVCYAINSSNYNTPLSFSDANIKVKPLPILPDYVYSDHDTLNIVEEIDINLFAEGGLGDKLIWSELSCGEDLLGEGNPLTIFRPENTTTYYAQWENDCGISSCEEVTVVIMHQFGVFSPNAFTPNGDGLNDEFKMVSANDLYSFRLTIFSRWGQQIFESDDLYQGWDGTYNGKPVNAGAYVWKVTYQFRSEGSGSEHYVNTGTVMLVR